jgi:hypothetical protein
MGDGIGHHGQLECFGPTHRQVCFHIVLASTRDVITMLRLRFMRGFHTSAFCALRHAHVGASALPSPDGRSLTALHIGLPPVRPHFAGNLTATSLRTSAVRGCYFEKPRGFPFHAFTARALFTGTPKGIRLQVLDKRYIFNTIPVLTSACYAEHICTTHHLRSSFRDELHYRACALESKYRQAVQPFKNTGSSIRS